METKSKSLTGHIIFVSIVAALGGILFGYDTAVISGTIGMVTTQFTLDSMSAGWYVGCALIGSIIGVTFAGTLSDYLGRKPTMLISALLFTVSALGCAVSANFTWLVVFRIIGGIGIGIVSIVSPIYISEVSPADKRGTMVSLYQLAITIGFLLAYVANYAILECAAGHSYSSHLLQRIMVDEMWRGMLGSETIVAAAFLILIFFIPESERWLREREAIKLAKRSGDNVCKEGKWSDLLSPGILTAVVVGSSIAILGQFMGVNAVLYYGPSIFESAGLSSADSMFSQVLVGTVNFLTTIIAVFIIDRVGRKKLIYWGVSGMIISLLMIGIYFAAGSKLGLGSTFLLVFFLFYVFCCAISICAVVFVLLSEMYPNSVRGRAMSIAGLALWIGTYLIGQLTPLMLERLTPAGTFFLFAGMCIPYMLIMWKLVPETTNKTLEEIEAWWRNGNSVKRFSSGGRE